MPRLSSLAGQSFWSGGGSGGSTVTAMSQLVISNQSGPSYNSVTTAWGWVGPGISLTGPSSPYITISLVGKKFTNGLRIVLQAAGGASSNNDGDGDSSANSGATAVFDIGPTFSGTSLDIWIGPAGPNYSNSGGSQQNVNPRSISGISNPIGAYGVQPGQGGYAANAAYDAAVLSNGNILAYAEGGPATPNYDSRNENPARAYVNTGITGISSVFTANGPISPGRGSWAGNTSYPLWNFSQYSGTLGTAYGRYSDVSSNRYGQGGWEAYLSSPGYNGQPGFVWVIIL